MHAEPNGSRSQETSAVPSETTGAADAPSQSRFAVVEALLKSPADLVHAMRDGSRIHVDLAVVVLATMALTGVSIATFGGGMQFLVVPLKVTLGIAVCALVCFPSLHIFACLSGGRQSARETWGALLMALALMGVLLVGFAPVAWVFSYATTSARFMGTIHVTFFAASVALAVGLLRRVLDAMSGGAIRGIWLWGILFFLVTAQLSTTLRPLVGPFDGELFHSRRFFLSHWLD